MSPSIIEERIVCGENCNNDNGQCHREETDVMFEIMFSCDAEDVSRHGIMTTYSFVSAYLPS